MARSKEELRELNVEQLKDEARRLEVSGFSTMLKEDLVDAVADAEGSSDDQAVGHNSEASDPQNEEVQEGLSPEGQDALEEYGEDSAYVEESDLALDASGPLHFESPARREMTGAVSEEHAKEQEELLKNKPDDYVGLVTEAGFDEDGNVITDSDRTRKISKKDNLGPGDDRELYEVRQEDVIDFAPPVGQRSFDRADTPETVNMPPRGVFSAHISPAPAVGDVTQDSRRGYQQKAVFYTDGLSGAADHNHERAYEYNEYLQSNDPAVREAGDESLSEAAKAAKSEEDNRYAAYVKDRDGEGSQASENSENE